MSLDYFLSTRKKLNNIINNLNSAFNDMDSLYEDALSEDERIDNIKLYRNTDGKLHRNPVLSLYFNNNLKDHIRNAENSKAWCDDNIHKLCKHEFVNDTIDVDPERSQNITYCIICEYTK